MHDSRLPFFVVIGAMKAGTTSLHEYLSLHPELSMPLAGKELNFFNDDEKWSEGRDWYRRQFDRNASKKGEVSPNYSMYPASRSVPERMHSLLPEARLIYILRDPIERLLSHVRHQWIDGRETREIDEILADTDDRWHYVGYGRYHEQLSRFLPFYNPERILIVTLESLAADPRSVMRRIFEFLEVDAGFESDAFGTKSNVSNERLRPGRILRAVNAGPLAALKGAIPDGLRGRLKRSVASPLPQVGLSEAQRAGLIAAFRDDVARMAEFAQRDFEEWKHRY